MGSLDPVALSRPAEKCGAFAIKHQNEQIPSPSPFSKRLDMPSEQVFSGYMGCNHAVDKSIPLSQRDGMCSCLADVIRTLPRETLRQMQMRKLNGQPALSLIPKKKLQFCADSHNVQL
jgi:hypothetical protein